MEETARKHGSVAQAPGGPVMRAHIENAVAAVAGSLLIAAPFAVWFLRGV